jgi:hypothetical protein
MEKNSDSVPPSLGSEGPPDHSGLSGRGRLVSSRFEAPATKASTFQRNGFSRGIYYPAVPIQTPRSLLPEERLEPDDMRREMMHINKRLLMKHYSGVRRLYPCVFMSLIRNTLRFPDLPS